jgi:uncharacterized circularly permuted ATP-grasp superfamily protein
MRFDGYDPGSFWDELIQAPGSPRAAARGVVSYLNQLPDEELEQRRQAASLDMRNMGITFTVYRDGAGIDREWPFDIVPRVIDAEEWYRIEDGLRQRAAALNMFIDDVYGDQKVIADGVFPGELLVDSANYRPEVRGVHPRFGAWAHICGSDLVRDGDGTVYVLEDNLRCPSGVSYVLENREVMKQSFPRVFDGLAIRPVGDYPGHLLSMLEEVAPEGVTRPSLAVLTPGPGNSAYFEHSFLARLMGVELVEGQDLIVAQDRLQMRTTEGLERVDVLYRRIDDDFLDPDVFRPDSLLGVPGLMDLYRRGRLTLVNAPGTGVADDKVVYAYVPDMIRYYLGEDAIIPNVPTYLCWRDEDRRYVLDHLDALVVKAANEAGGYGMLVGPHASAEQREDFAQRVTANPRNYIAQPTLSLSRVPTRVDDHFEGRHVDLRPYVLYGRDVFVLPGGLTRVALRKGSLVVNSSQGGGSKDTWVLR